MTPEREAEFWSRAERDGECLIWTRSRTGRGYGSFRVNGENAPAHRLSYQLTKGPIPDGLVVRHTCDRPACIEPRHLLIGTTLDNMRDKYERGRAAHPHGGQHYRTRLTEETVVEMRMLRAAGVAAQDIARRFGLSRSATSAICTGVQWRHAGGPLTHRLSK